MALARGFMQVEFRANVLGERVINSFYYGMEDNSVFEDPVGCEELVQAAYSQLFSAESTAFGVSAYRQLFASFASVTGFRVLVKGELGLLPVQITGELNLVGQRGTTTDPLAPNLTYSCYAGLKLFRGKGAKTAFSGAVEGDYNGQTGWLDGALLYKEVVDDFLFLAGNEEGEILIGGVYSMIPAVVQRVPYTTSAGKPASRLPLEAGDNPIVKEVNQFVGGQFAGRQKRRAKPIRGS